MFRANFISKRDGFRSWKRRKGSCILTHKLVWINFWKPSAGVRNHALQKSPTALNILPGILGQLQGWKTRTCCLEPSAQNTRNSTQGNPCFVTWSAQIWLQTPVCIQTLIVIHLLLTSYDSSFYDSVPRVIPILKKEHVGSFPYYSYHSPTFKDGKENSVKTPKKSLSDQWELMATIFIISCANVVSTKPYIVNNVYRHVWSCMYIWLYSEYIMVSYIHKELCLRGGISSIDYIIVHDGIDYVQKSNIDSQKI